jgi:hypothetical protein
MSLDAPRSRMVQARGSLRSTDVGSRAPAQQRWRPPSASQRDITALHDLHYAALPPSMLRATTRATRPGSSTHLQSTIKVKNSSPILTTSNSPAPVPMSLSRISSVLRPHGAHRPRHACVARGRAKPVVAITMPRARRGHARRRQARRTYRLTMVAPQARAMRLLSVLRSRRMADTPALVR